MSGTKQKILARSLGLFNDCGTSAVSLRDIADAAKISVGNLQYHFKKREDIIEALYFQIVEKIDGITFIKTDHLVASFFNISKEMISVLYEYRFFVLDFVSITRGNQKIKKHYAEVSKKREEDILELLHILIKEGLLRQEKLQNEYHYLYKRTEVISNFWFSSKLLQSSSLSKTSIKEYLLLISQSIYPYLTHEGKCQYVEIFPEQKG